MRDKLPDHRILVPKFDAGRRQLHTAIQLWFRDDDTVSVHTLAAAAYEILHNLSRLRGSKNLLFDTPLVNDSARRDFVKHLKAPAQFLKHADRDPYGTIELSSLHTEAFTVYSIAAISKMGEKLSTSETAALFWLSFSNPQLIEEGVRKNIRPEVFQQISSIPKGRFLEFFSQAWEAGRFRGNFTFTP